MTKTKIAKMLQFGVSQIVVTTEQIVILTC